jgi:hypothetical protein
MFTIKYNVRWMTVKAVMIRGKSLSKEHILHEYIYSLNNIL